MTTADLHPVSRFRSKISRSAAISLTEQLKSQLPQAQQLVTRRLVPYIVRDGQWQCGIRPKAPSITHPARRVMPNAKRQTDQRVESYSILSFKRLHQHQHQQGRWCAVRVCQMAGAPFKLSMLFRKLLKKMISNHQPPQDQFS
jgi:hypothetical protein